MITFKQEGAVTVITFKQEGAVTVTTFNYCDHIKSRKVGTGRLEEAKGRGRGLKWGRGGGALGELVELV